MISTIRLEGKLLVFDGAGPFLCRIIGDPRWCVPVYSSIETLKRAACEFAFPDAPVKQITDGLDFLDSIHETSRDVLVILDPHKQGNKLRYAIVLEAPLGER